MKAAIVAGFVVCLASVAYAHGNDDNDPSNNSMKPNTSASAKRSEPKSKQEQEKLSPVATAALNRLHAINQTEIDAGQMAAKKTSSAAVRRYAEMLVKDHRSLDHKVESLARRRSAELSSKAMGLGQLGQRKADQFDGAFLTMMVKGHNEAIGFLKESRKSVDDRDMRQLFDQALPVLQKHLRQAEQLQKQARSM